MVIAALRHGVRDKDLRKELHLHLPKNVDRLMMIAERHMVAEEDMKAFAPPPKRLGLTEGRRVKRKGVINREIKDPGETETGDRDRP